MKQIYKEKYLGLPIIIWVLQLVYVAVALGVLVILLTIVNTESQKSIVIGYIAVMLVINVIWRSAIRKKM